MTSHDAPLHAADTIWSALARAQGLVRSVDKDATNQHMRYQYASAEAVIDEARRALSQCGLSLHQSDLVIEGVEAGHVRGSYVLAHASGQTTTITASWAWESGKGRPADKAVAGATTTALSYVLRGLLLIPRGLEGEDRPDRRDDRDYQPPRASWDGRAAQAAPPATSQMVAHADERTMLRRRYVDAVSVLGRDQATELVGPVDGSTPTEQIRAIVATLEAAARDVAGG
jgi:hypothetical protein